MTTSTHSHTLNRQAFTVCFLAALAGLLFGLDMGVIAGALPFLARTFDLNSHQQEIVVSVMMFGAALGALCSGPMSSSLGRRRSLLLGATLFVVGSLGCAAAGNMQMLAIARFILGLAVGVASFTAPLYLSEIAPERIRGSMISLYQLMITIGILAAFVSDTALSGGGHWRWMLGIITFPAVVLFIGVLTLPESPRWLMMKRRDALAASVLKRLRNSDKDAQHELNQIRESVKIKQRGWQLFRHNAHFRRSTGLGILLQFMQQFTGMTVIMYYAPKIFEIAGFATTRQQMWGTVIAGLTNVLATFIAIGLVDRWGRKPVLKLGFAVMAVCMGILGFMFYSGLHSAVGQYLAVLILLLFITGFAMSAGPLIWVLCSEIQPLAGRDFGVTCSTMANWIANMIIGASFLTLIDTIGSPNTFWLYGLLNVVCIVLTLLFVPETKNISLEDIERNLMNGAPLRLIGQPVASDAPRAATAR
ncbi:sugar porter family MFS transporter [Cronobacter turicensis]|uniref:Sugar porter family MFS transporter n=2 Tax=Cronobacter turicensis TaxID=413502 RepID=A0A2T7B8G6_9ENTR|nr:sugar porter family MFS transporter [Cronobacter turicensis]EGT4492234.1 sugar porter family MFS transporter [Cronobacter turicensis]EKM0436957.1 sugar porter family MFS transporter [Cronobacter turicensis]EKM0665155.1 sugar porter family MFS transporter [Cronobacter turicensis]EKY1943976.1 sugar porter family MFS transporter [Cronobacter turicensis]EKY1992841.1 sugar porter family MFS transporter [Cronobacter turicensis]